MKQFRLLAVLFVLANIAVVGFLVMNQGSGDKPKSLGDAMKPLVEDKSLDKTAYDLKARADELNVILISLDALRFDRTGVGGNKDGLTPNLDAFAEEAVVFHKATAPAPWTLPSHMSMFTGRWPSIHGVTNKLKMLANDQMVDASLSPGIETYPDHLIRQGWKAVAFTGGAGVASKFGYGRGFETYLDDKPFAGFEYSIPPALEWIGKNRDTRFFMFLHGYDSHGQHPVEGNPRDAMPDYKGTLDGGIEEQARLREEGFATIKTPGQTPDLSGSVSPEDVKFLKAVYDKKVRLADQRLGSFLSQLRANGLLDKSIVAIVSDHGDEFMEHGYVDHGGSLCEHQLHTVFMIRFPGYARRNDVTQNVRMLDVFPTIFDALGIQGPGGADGKSLLPMLRGEPQDVPIFAETDYRLFVHHRMTRKGDKKIVLDLEDGQKQLFDVAADPDEQNDISSKEQRTSYEMEQALRGWMDQTRTNPQDYLNISEKPIEIF
ncbi:MAG: sulfatase [Myxococcota bacterium]